MIDTYKLQIKVTIRGKVIPGQERHVCQQRDTESFREWLENLDTAKTSSQNRGRERSSRKEEHTLKFLTWPLDRHVPFRWLKTDQFKQRDGYIQKVF